MKTALALLLLVALCCGTGCHRAAQAENQDQTQTSPGDTNQVVLRDAQLASVSVEPVESCTTPITKPLNGRMVWDENVTTRIFTPFGGRVTKINVEIGQKVSKGDCLALIASPDYGQAQSDARRAASDFALAERNLARLKDLFEHGAAPEKDLQAAQADFESKQSEKQRSAARLALYGGNTDTVDQVYAIRSPLDGIVVERNLNPGQEVRADSMLANTEKLAAPMFVVTDPTRLWVEIDAFEQDLPKLQEGADILIRSRAYPNRAFSGKIQFVSDSLDQTRKVITVRGAVGNPDRQLKAEMFVTAELVAHSNAAAGLDVPEKAVFYKGEKPYVFVEQSRGHFERHEVKVGPEHAVGPERKNKILVLDGIAPGQRVVTEGCLLLDQALQNGAGT